MRRVEQKTKSFKNVIIESFGSIGELISTNDSRTSKFGNVRESCERGFQGVANYKEAVELLGGGWTSEVERFRKSVTKVDSKQLLSVKKPVFTQGVAGFLPIVPNALMGLPNSMIDVKLDVKKAKVVNVLIDSTVSCGTSTQEILDWGSKVVVQVMNLERNGWRCKVDVIYSFTSYSDEWGHVIKFSIKDENQPFDIKRLMFPMAHSAMFRVFGFDWYERLPGGHYISGYGQGLCYWRDKEKVQEILDVAGSGNYLYVNFNSDLPKVFENVK